MIFRKVSLGAVIISLTLLLSSCVEVRGDLSVSSAARINGEITYTLSKTLAAGAGLSTLADVKNEASSNQRQSSRKETRSHSKTKLKQYYNIRRAEYVR
jgi:hypothetical protein